MKFLKWLLMLLGLAALIAGGAILVNVIWDMGKLMAAVRGYNTGVGDPTNRIYYTVGLAALGGLLLGWGIGLPGRTSRAVRNQYRTEMESQGLISDRDGDGRPDRG
ncbi:MULTISPECIES: hypothetical protein [unclassified Luteococcus]|uniref:hypothetical protein n=1 Tax=unclassified Luteococcus TaxID=2639923 RepID=UPI00313D7303